MTHHCSGSAKETGENIGTQMQPGPLQTYRRWTGLGVEETRVENTAYIGQRAHSGYNTRNVSLMHTIPVPLAKVAIWNPPGLGKQGAVASEGALSNAQRVYGHTNSSFPCQNKPPYGVSNCSTLIRIRRCNLYLFLYFQAQTTTHSMKQIAQCVRNVLSYSH